MDRRVTQGNPNTRPERGERKMILANAVESLHSRLRKAVRVRGHFPSDEAASKLLFLVLREVSQNWKMASREWNAARTQFAVMFGDRFVTE
jgi:putative transposase